MGSLPNSVPIVKVLVVGGSYAGLSATLNLLDLGAGNSTRMALEPYLHHPDLPKVDFRITVVDERDGYYHLIGSPLALADSDFAKKAWVKFEDIPALRQPNINVVHGSVSSVDCESKTATVLNHTTKIASTHEYDYLVSASGLRRVWPVVPQSLTRKQYLMEAEEHIYAVSNARHGVVVVGGGAVGIEMAAELKLLQPDIKVTLVHSRDKLLSAEGLDDECKDRALELLKEANVEVLLNHRLKETKDNGGEGCGKELELEFTNGHTMVASEVIMAMSKSVPSTTYLPTSALDSEGYVNIKANLGFASGTPNDEYHFCAGDAAKWTGIKRCGAAMHGGHYAAYNIHQSVMKRLLNHEPKFQELREEVPPMIGLAVGKQAVASGPEGTVSGTDVMQAYFRDDLGWTICWEYMQLGKTQADIKM